MKTSGGLAPAANSNKQERITLTKLMCREDVKNRFSDILGEKSAGFISSVINVSKSPELSVAEPTSILSSAVVAATLDLPIDPNLGFAYIIPYNTKKKNVWVKEAQFQIGYKGFLQLAMRSNQYKTINAGPIFEGELKSINRLTGEIELNNDPELLEKIEEGSLKVVGYLAYFKLLNGYEKTIYMTRKQVENHAMKYSKSYSSKNENVRKSSNWTTDFDDMATKTVLKRLLSKFGPLSIDMQKALKVDQASFEDDVIKTGNIEENISYPDNDGTVIDVEYKSKNETVATQEDVFTGSIFENK